MQGPHFIKQIILQDLKAGKNKGQVVMRFPPEPNGYLHLGHSKAIALNFGLAQELKGVCHLRFDDTNPASEEEGYIKAIQKDIQWLGFKWDKLFYASDYFDKLYDFAVQLIQQGLAYVDDQTGAQIKKNRGTLTEAGVDSPFRTRKPEENLKLFTQMREGKLKEGQCVLRARIDMASPNMNMRDPIMYRILKTPHHRTKNKWCIYPLYDFTHGQSDMIEGITHSLCTLEFEDHRPLYDWFLEKLNTPHRPQQIEFSRGEMDYTVLSKRHLSHLVKEKIVNGWDDPRMPTLCGLRRRGYRPQAILNFWASTSITKKNSTLSLNQLEWAVRDDLNTAARRAMAVLKPIKVTISNWPEGKTLQLKAPCHPKDPLRGERDIVFSRHLYIEQSDFNTDPPKKYFRLRPGGRVRLRYAYVIECKKVITDPTTGQVIELHCEYDERTLGGRTPEGEKKVKGIIHWLSREHCLTAQVYLYDRLFCQAKPNTQNLRADLNPHSLELVKKAFIEPSVNQSDEQHFQFERLGFFVKDPASQAEALVFNRTVGLKEWQGG